MICAGQIKHFTVFEPYSIFSLLYPNSVFKKGKLKNHRTFWAERDPQGSASAALKSMAHMGSKPITPALWAPYSNLSN